MTASEHETNNTTPEEREPVDHASETDQDRAVDEAVSDRKDVSPGEQHSMDALNAALATRDERISALEEQLIALEQELSTTVSRYRLALLDTAPDVPGDLVSGATAEELEASLTRAKGVVEQVRTRLLEGMESAQQADERVDGLVSIPAGAPPRGLHDGAADLTTREKISLGLERL